MQRKTLFKLIALINFSVGIVVFVLYSNGYFNRKVKSNKVMMVSKKIDLKKEKKATFDTIKEPEALKKEAVTHFENQHVVKERIQKDEILRMSSSKSMISKPNLDDLLNPSIRFDTLKSRE